MPILGYRRACSQTYAQDTIVDFEVALKHSWYSIDLPMRYEGVRKDASKGFGRTLAMTSSTIRFAIDQELQVGIDQELQVGMPVWLGNLLARPATGWSRPESLVVGAD